MARTSRSSGIGLGGVLTIIFITLKLTNNIDWSWWWVLCPIWIPFAFFFTMAGVVFFISVAGD